MNLYDQVLLFSLQWDKIRKVEDLPKLEIFFPHFSYIVLRTEYINSASTENKTEINKYMEKTEINHCTSSEKVTESSCEYYIYFIITDYHHSEVAYTVVNRVVQLLKHVQGKSHKVVTIARETHKMLSYEFYMLFHSISGQQRAGNIQEWSKMFESNFSFNLYRLNLFSMIEQVSPDVKNINKWEAFITDFGTDVLAIRTFNKFLQKLTQNFTNFIKRCRSKNLNTYIVNKFNDIFYDKSSISKILQSTREDTDLMKYQLIEYEGTTEMRRFRTEFGSSILTSYNIKRDKNYILTNETSSKIFVLITPESNIETIKFMLSKGELLKGSILSQLLIVQPHILNLLFMTAFHDVIPDILENKITDKVRKFVTVCKS